MKDTNGVETVEDPSETADPRVLVDEEELGRYGARRTGRRSEKE